MEHDGNGAPMMLCELAKSFPGRIAELLERDRGLKRNFPADLISHAVWLYHVFSLSFRDVELLLAERGVFVSHESIRRWCRKFGAAFADNLRRRRPLFWCRAAAMAPRQALLQAPPHRPAVCATRPHHGQAEELRRRPTRTAAGRRASPEPIPEQPGGELAPADPATRAADAALQVGAPGTTFPIRSCLYIRTLSPPAASHDGEPLSCRACKSL